MVPMLARWGSRPVRSATGSPSKQGHVEVGVDQPIPGQALQAPAVDDAAERLGAGAAEIVEEDHEHVRRASGASDLKIGGAFTLRASSSVIAGRVGSAMGSEVRSRSVIVFGVGWVFGAAAGSVEAAAPLPDIAVALSTDALVSRKSRRARLVLRGEEVFSNSFSLIPRSTLLIQS